VPRLRRPPKQVQRRLEPLEIDGLVERYMAGATLREVAAEFGIHRYTAAGHLERRGVARRFKGLDFEVFERAAELYADGLSFTDVAERVGANRNTIRRAFLASGVPIRPRPGWFYS